MSTSNDQPGGTLATRSLSLWMMSSGVVVLVWLCWGVVAIWWLAPSLCAMDLTRAGQLGDVFGGVNALFSGLSLLAIGYTIYLQHLELRGTRAALQKALDTQSIIEIRNVLQSEHVRAARARVQALPEVVAVQTPRETGQPSAVSDAMSQAGPETSGLSVTLWDDHMWEAAETVCHTYEFAGILVRNGMIRRELIFESWGPSIAKCWNRLEPMTRDNSRGFRLPYVHFCFLAGEYERWRAEQC